MSISGIGIAVFGSAAIASPPVNDANVKYDDKPAESSPAQQIIEASRAPGTGQVVDKKV
jgi:hypothetical protein